ncbi:ZmpA/ZmpB/ZmpC family metallo-endopeptidase [Streptococcus pneumoniae]
MKDFYRNVSRFSIRTFSVGAASVLLGMSLVATSLQETVQAEEMSSCTKITYHYVSEDELSADEKKLITTALPSNMVTGETTYYMVYRPDAKGILPKTGSDLTALLVTGAGVAFLVCALVFHKKKKTWIATAFVVTSLGQVVAVPEVSAITHNLFAHLTQEFCLPNGGIMPEKVRDIDGYHFVGYIVEAAQKAQSTAPTEQVKKELSSDDTKPAMPEPEVEKHYEVPTANIPTVEKPVFPVEEVPVTPDPEVEKHYEVPTANIPTVEKPVLPVEEVAVTPEPGVEKHYEVPTSNIPTVEKPVFPVEEVLVTPEPEVEKHYEVPTANIPTVEKPVLPVEEVPVTPEPEVEKHYEVPTANIPTVEQPVFPVDEVPVTPEPEVEKHYEVPTSNIPTVEKPVFPVDEVPVTPEPEVEKHYEVPTADIPTVEKPVFPVDEVPHYEVPSENIPTVEKPILPIEEVPQYDVPQDNIPTVDQPVAPLELIVAADKLDQGLKKEVNTSKKTPESIADYQTAKDKANTALADANTVIADKAASPEKIAEAQKKVEEALKNLEAAEAALKNQSLTKPTLTFSALEKKEKDKSVRVSYQLIDPDNSFVSATAQIFAGDKLVKEVKLSKDDLAGAVISGLDYDVDYQLKTVFEYATLAENARETLPDVEAFVLERKQIELKNLRDLSLYTYKGGVKTKVISLQEIGDIKDYFASFVSETGKEVELPIKEIVADGASFKVVATHPELVQRSETGDYVDDYTFNIGRIAPAQNGIYTSFKDLIDSINANPSGTFTLGADLSADELGVPSASYVTVPFTGTLTGVNGGKNFTIYGLKAPLFASTNGASLTNLNLADVAIRSANANAATLVNTAQNTTIRNVAVTGAIEAPNNVAGLVYDAASGTKIQDVDLDMTIRTTKTDGEMISGGLVGKLRDSSIEKAHINAQIDTYVNSGQAFGGIIGSAEGKTPSIQDVYVEGLLDNKKGGRVGAIAGNPGNTALHRIVSGMTVRGGSDYVGAGTPTNTTELYRIENRSTASVQSNKLTEIPADEAKAKIDAMGLTASLSDKESLVGATSKTIDYSTLPNYEAEREIAYRNTEKLLPFYNREYIVKQGNKIDASSKLYTTKLVSVVPMKDKVVVADLYKDKTAINRLMLHYADGTVEYVNLALGETFADNTIQEYKLAGGELLYTPEQFMTDPSDVIATAMTRVAGLGYFSEDVWKVTQRHPETEADSPDLSPIEPYQREILEVLSLKNAFDEVNSRAKEVFEAALAQSVAADFTASPMKTQMQDYMRKNAVAILVGATYLNRLYKIQFGKMNVGELATFYQNFFGNQVNSLEFLANLGRMGNDALDIKNNPATYEKWIAPVSGYNNLRDYLSAYRTRFTTMSENDWFKSATKAHIAEAASKELPDQTYQVYDQLNRIDHTRLILPLLNLTTEGIYVMSNMTTLSFGMYDRYMDMSLKETDPAKYASEIERVDKLVDYYAKVQANHFDFWYRIAKPEVKERLYSRRDIPIPSWDGYLIPKFGNKESYWMPKFGEGASPRMTDFFAPIGKYYTSNGLGAYATGSLVHFVLDRMLDLYGESVFTHEMTHNFDGTIYLGGHGRRETLGAEVFAQGLLQSTSTATNQIFSLNTHADFAEVDGGKFATNRVHNLSPERFQTEADLKAYSQGQMDVIYTLEALEANALVKLAKEDQALFYKKIERLNDIGESKIRQMTAEEVQSLTLASVNDLVDNDILLGTHGFHANKDKIGKNGYDHEVLFAANYSGLTNPHGSSDSLTIKRLAFELLGETGYDGFIAYLSNQYRAAAQAEGKVFNDEYILKKISNGAYADFHAFKKAMYQRRLDKVGQLKPVTFTYAKNTYTADQATLNRLIGEAVEADLAAFKAKKATNNLFALKEAIYKAYLLDTDDFRASIYQ